MEGHKKDNEIKEGDWVQVKPRHLWESLGWCQVKILHPPYARVIVNGRTMAVKIEDLIK